MKDTEYEQGKLLQKLKSLAEEDVRVRGLWVVRSMATDKVDKYSDLDAYILVENKNYDKVFSERSSFAEKIGKVLSSFEVEWPNCQLYGVILENCVEVDLCYCKPEQIEIFGPYKIIFDRKGDLQELLSKHTVKFETDAKKHLGEHLELCSLQSTARNKHARQRRILVSHSPSRNITEKNNQSDWLADTHRRR